jgi:hypothetical protein
MPYINSSLQTLLSKDPLPVSAGELNYCFTKLIDGYLGHGLSYQRINDVIGALEGAKLEFYRRVVVPYEKKKMTENGDVYSPEYITKGTY